MDDLEDDEQTYPSHSTVQSFGSVTLTKVDAGPHDDDELVLLEVCYKLEVGVIYDF